MAASFDHIAKDYDGIFTTSVTGQLQRKQVWSYLHGIMPQLRGNSILELNCGTGEDAVWLASRGFNVLATDISQQMRAETRRKAKQSLLDHRIATRRIDLTAFETVSFGERKFDLVFSNFGGLNCIDPVAMDTFFARLPDILNPGGRFIGVIMPKFCAWETLFFLYKLQFRQAFRRLTSKAVIANLHGVSLKTWYYSPSDIRSRGSRFTLIDLNPVGIALPPSYLDSFFRSRPDWLRRLNMLEKSMSAARVFSGMADHFIIDLELL